MTIEYSVDMPATLESIVNDFQDLQVYIKDQTGVPRANLIGIEIDPDELGYSEDTLIPRIHRFWFNYFHPDDGFIVTVEDETAKGISITSRISVISGIAMAVDRLSVAAEHDTVVLNKLKLRKPNLVEFGAEVHAGEPVAEMCGQLALHLMSYLAIVE